MVISFFSCTFIRRISRWCYKNFSWAWFDIPFLLLLEAWDNFYISYEYVCFFWVAIVCMKWLIEIQLDVFRGPHSGIIDNLLFYLSFLFLINLFPRASFRNLPVGIDVEFFYNLSLLSERIFLLPWFCLDKFWYFFLQLNLALDLFVFFVLF